MTIEILRPELERLIRERMERGGFETVEDALLDALKPPPAQQPRRPKKPLGQFLLESPLSGSGLNLERKRDYPRPVSL
ncbi:MAG: hypothetical protein JNL98_33165 [Bryobacterales bacterium]|nr:hypothetical protein [Bryobacterales bacterium]